MIKDSIVVYTSDRCPYCYHLKKWFNDNDIKFTEKNLSKNPNYLLELEQRQIKNIPVTIFIDTNGQEKYIVGLNKKKLKQMLNVR
jgi:glutaredoxin